MEDIFDELDSIFYSEIKSKDKFSNAKTEYTGSASESQLAIALAKGLSNSILEFYQETNKLVLNWDFDLKQNLCGRLNIISLEHFLESWEDKLYYDGCDNKLRNFQPIDIFVAETCCGLVLNESEDKTMYYHTFGEAEIYPLDIDFKGYMELGIEAHWFLDWQMYIVELVNGEQPVEIPFKDGGMKEVFPDFDLGAFKQKFEELRLSNRK